MRALSGGRPNQIKDFSSWKCIATSDRNYSVPEDTVDTIPLHFYNPISRLGPIHAERCQFI